MPKLLLLIAEEQYFLSHRLPLAQAAEQAGFEVALATTPTNHSSPIKLFPLRYFSRAGINPIKQLLALWELYQIYRRYRPDVVHHVAIKPVIFGTFIAKCTGVPTIINALGGLGYLFTDTKNTIKKRLLKTLITRLFRYAFATGTTLLQNTDDQNTLASLHLFPKKTIIIRGSGVNTSRFSPKPFPKAPPIVIACVARMLWTKGIHELVQAAQRLTNANVILYGDPDASNPEAIDPTFLADWQRQGSIEWRGYTESLIAYENAHIAVLPSYREGLPKSLLEAASMARAIVTTDVPGCREVVIHEHTGLLVPPKDVAALAQALQRLIDDPTLRETLGKNARQHVEKHFSERLVQQQTLALYLGTDPNPTL